MIDRSARGVSGPRLRWRGLLIPPVVAILTACGTDEEAQDAVMRWLTCDECVDGELAMVVDTLGSRATPLLREALLETPQDYMDNVERSLRAAASRRTNPVISSDEYVARFLANYRAVLQGRAAEALGELGETRILQEAYRESAGLGYRDDVVEVIEEALLVAGGASAGLDAGSVERILLRPDSVDVELGRELVLEAVALGGGGRTLAAPLAWSISDSAVISPLRAGPASLRVTGSRLGGAMVTASSGGVSGQAILRVVPAGLAPGRITIVSGDLQVVSLSAGDVLDTLRVRVENASGAPIAGIEVAFRVIRGEDTVGALDLSMDTDAAGEASVFLDLSPIAAPGAVWVDAAAVAIPGRPLSPRAVRFRLRVLP